jgi:hypothetical protein
MDLAAPNLATCTTVHHVTTCGLTNEGGILLITFLVLLFAIVINITITRMMSR